MNSAIKFLRGLWLAVLLAPALVAHAGSTTTTIQASPNPSTVGQTVTFTATVTGSSPTGTVTFSKGGAPMAVMPLVGNVATYATSGLAVGTHSSIKAQYNGDPSNIGSASALISQVVSKATTSTTLSTSVTPSRQGETVTFTATVAGGFNPGGSVEFRDGATLLQTAALVGDVATYVTSSLALGGHSITAKYLGDSSNTLSTSATLTQTVGATSTSLTSSPNPSLVGQNVGLQVVVSGGGSAPGGTVRIKDGATTLSTIALPGNAYSIQVNTLTAGSHNLTAEYTGNGSYLASTSPVLVQVVQAPTTTTLTSTPNASNYGQAVLFTATVSGTAPTGTVLFNSNGATLGTGTVAGSGNARTATFSISSLPGGTNTVTAVYSGDSGNAASTSAVRTQTVNRASSTTSVVASPNPSTFGQSVTLTATVTAQSPTGQVTFLDGATNLGTATLTGSGNSRTAVLATSALAAGTRSITAAYAGDTNNNTSTSPAYSQVVNPAAPSTTTLASSANPSTFGQTVTWTATVNGSSPSGVVTFKDGTTVIGTTTVAGGTAAFSSGALTGGAHSLTAAYAGDANNGASTSAALAQTVNPAATTTTLVANVNPSTFGQTVTWTATVNGSSPSGVITFKDGTTVLGTATVASGSAALSRNTLAGGAHSLTATYEGDANNATSTSTALAQTVNPAATTTTLVASVNPSTFGQTVTWTASVSGSNPTGVVTFKDGTTVLGTATVASGAGSFTTGALTTGSHSLTAVYEGDASNATSTSAALTQTVNGPPATVTLSATPNPAVAGQNVTLGVQVGGNSPTGTVTFNNGGSAIGTASLTSGGATLSLPGLATGTHTLSASYAGDANNAANTSNTVTLTVTAQGPFAWQYGYDAMGRMHTIVDPNSLTTNIYYDSLGRPIQTQQPANTGSNVPTVIQYGYDAQDNLTRVVDPRVLTTTYTVTGLGTVKEQASPDSGLTQNTAYDAKGNLLTSIDARGKATQYAYDSLDRVTSISYPTGVGTTFEYDGGPSGPANEKGELTKMTDESGQTVYTHDSMGRLTAKSVTIGTRTFAIGYGWGDSGTALDKLTSITYPSGNKVNYGYDDKGSISSISVNAVNPNGSGTSGTSQTLLSGIAYNADGNVTRWLWSDGKQRNIGYDSIGQISSYSLGDPTGSGTTRSVHRDSAGRITGYSHSNNAATLNQSFGYDNLNRLVTATIASTSTVYEYDETGNRKSKTIGGTTYTNTIAATSNKLTQTQDVNGTATIVHDAAGHITSDGTNTFTYNDRGRMTSATTPGGMVSYLYNGLNQRVSKSGPANVVPTGTGYFLYDEGGQLLGEYDANGTPVYETIYLGGTPVGALKQTGSAGTNDIAVSLYNVHTDQIATPRTITKQDHTIVWRWDAAEAFGATAPDQNPSNLGTFVFNQRFPGQVFDSETGLFQNWNREYNARLGSYIQSDPIGLEGGINTFSYVGADPLQVVDPLGLQAIPKRGGYDQNDVRGGFDSRGASLVYHPDFYNPGAAAELLIFGAMALGPCMCAAATEINTVRRFASMGGLELKEILKGRQTHLLSEFFKKGVPIRPRELTNEAIAAYKEFAKRAICEYEKTGNLAGISVQQARLKLLSLLQ